MKKLGRILSAVVLAISMLLVPSAAFAEDASPQQVDAYRLYLSASQKMRNAKSLFITGTGKMSALFADESYYEPLRFENRILYNSKNELQTVCVTTFSDGLSYMEYYKDGYLYTDFSSKTKRKSSEKDALFNAIVLNRELPKELFKDATVEDIEGGKRIKLMLADSQLNDLVDGFYDEAMDDSDDIKFGKEVPVYLTIGDDGNLKSYRFIITMYMYEDIAVNAEISMTMNIASVDTITEIDYPIDLACYKKV